MKEEQNKKMNMNMNQVAAYLKKEPTFALSSVKMPVTLWLSITTMRLLRTISRIFMSL